MNAQPADWQSLTQDCGLQLHGSFGDFRDLLPALQAEFAALEACIDPALRGMRACDGSWSNLDLILRDKTWGRPGHPTSALALMPSVAALIQRTGLTVLGAHILRQPPQGLLPWHFEDQAPYSVETRLLIPLHVPQGSVTWVSHEPVVYPEGIGWCADVNFPHQVENPTDQQRIILALDVLSDQAARDCMPQGLLEGVDQRHTLAQQARNHLLMWRMAQ